MNAKRFIKHLIMILVLIIPTIGHGATCNYAVRSEMSKLAKNVSVAYEIKEDEFGSYYFDITIYNIVEGLYVTINETNGSTKKTKTDVFYTDANESNNYTFQSYDIYNVSKYTFSIGDVKSECTSSIRTLTLTKPRYNSFSELEECGFFGVEDLVYCQKWVTTSFKLTEDGVIEKIRQHRKNNLNKVTTQCLSCEENAKNQAKLERFYKIRKYCIIGLSIGIVADIALIIFLYMKIKKEII